jgi:hypothetical protein
MTLTFVTLVLVSTEMGTLLVWPLCIKAWPTTTSR